MDTLAQDVRYGVRMLVKSPGFTFVAILVLALGIGANTAIFSLVHAVMLESLPVARPGELVHVNTWTQQSGLHTDFSYPLYVDLRDGNQAFAGVLAFSDASFGVNAKGQTERAAGEFVTSNYFHVLGVQPRMGRTFTGPDELRGSAPVAVISHGLWQRMFAGDAGVLGKSISLNGHNFGIAGVAPKAFRGIVRGVNTDVWVTVGQYGALNSSEGNILERRTTSWLTLVGRLKPGMTREQAEAATTAVAHQFEVDTDMKNWSVKLLPAAQGDESLVATLQRPLRLLMIAVVLVLVIASANVANLLLARAKAREREIGVRVALGATRRRIVRQLLTESLLLACGGAAAGLIFATWLTEAARTVRSATGGPLALDVGLNYNVLAFTLVISLASAVFFGLAPAWSSSRPNLAHALKEEGSQITAGRRKAAFSNSLVVFQIGI